MFIDVLGKELKNNLCFFGYIMKNKLQNKFLFFLFIKKIMTKFTYEKIEG